MENSLKYALLASVLVHFGIFAALAPSRGRNIMLINLPVEFLPPPAAGNPASSAELDKSPEKTPPKKEKSIFNEIKTKAEELVGKKTKVIKKTKPAAKNKSKKEPKDSNKKEIPKGTGENDGINKTAGPYGDSGLMSSLRLDNARFPYTYYANGVRRIVDANWDYSKSVGNSRAVVYFRIKPTGEISDIKIHESSGNKVFDLLAKNAVERSQFPPLPVDYREDYLGIYFEFVYHE